jgi:hypothetical protein
MMVRVAAAPATRDATLKREDEAAIPPRLEDGAAVEVCVPLIREVGQGLVGAVKISGRGLVGGQLEKSSTGAHLAVRGLARRLGDEGGPAGRHRRKSIREVGNKRRSPRWEMRLHLGQALRPVLLRHDQRDVRATPSQRCRTIIRLLVLDDRRLDGLHRHLGVPGKVDSLAPQDGCLDPNDLQHGRRTGLGSNPWLLIERPVNGQSRRSLGARGSTDLE